MVTIDDLKREVEKVESGGPKAPLSPLVNLYELGRTQKVWKGPKLCMCSRPTAQKVLNIVKQHTGI